MSTVQRELNRFTYEDEARGIRIRIKQPVSYTHLTLPTIYSV